MFRTDGCKYLMDRIQRLLPDAVQINSEMLLKAYCSFWIRSTGYKGKCREYVWLELYSTAEEYEEVSEEFLCWDFFDFIEFVVTDYVMQPDIIRKWYGESEDYPMVATVIILLKGLCTNYRKNRKLTEDLIEQLHTEYLNTAGKYNVDPLNQYIFRELFFAVSTFEMDQNWMASSKNALNKNAAEAVDVLNNVLLVPKKSQYSICARLYQHESMTTLEAEYEPGPFCNLSKMDIKRCLKYIRRNLLRAQNPMDVLCAIYLRKRSLTKDSYIRKNDVSLENSIVYHYFRGNMSPKDSMTEGYAVFFPTPFFVKRLTQDLQLNSYMISFVVENEDIRDIYAAHFTNQKYSGARGRGFSFLTLEEFRAGLLQKEDYPFKSTLVFANHMEDKTMEWMVSVLHGSLQKEQNVFFLGTEKQFAVFAMHEECFRITTDAMLVARGIVNATEPRIKVFWKCIEANSDNSSEDNVQFQNTEIVSPKRDKQRVMESLQLSVTMQMLQHASFRISRLFDVKSESQSDISHRRKPPDYIRFSDEIDIWYSMTRIRGDEHHVRIEAYVCGEIPEGKTERGYLPRGKRIPGSLKRYTRATESEVCHWLQYEYPYSNIGKQKKQGEKSAVRDAISAYYKKQYADSGVYCNITIRTLWYIYLELETRLSVRDYAMLGDMAKGPIGDMSTEFSNINNYFGEVRKHYPQDSEVQVERKIQILYIALETAVRYHHATSNPLEEFVSGNDEVKGKYLQVLDALTKKSFTKNEYQQVYRKIRWNLNHGNYEHIGLMIKLFTGLETEIVCGLRWEDFVEIGNGSNAYNLFVYRRLTGNGNEYIGLRALNDYRCVPCCSLLRDHLLALRNKIQQKFPETYLTMPIVAFNDDEWCQTPVSPKQLYQIIKKVISALEIENVTIPIPYTGNDVKERNLNQYGGDIFKSNFKHWALLRGGLTLDEIAYVLGNEAVTTFGRHYCDFANEDAQMELIVKLNRIGAMFTGMTPKIVKKESCSKEVDMKFFAQYAYPITATLIVEVEKGTEVSIETEYGMSVTAQKIL